MINLYFKYGVIFTIMLMLVGCFESETVQMVKGGTLQACPDANVEQMVAGFMGSPSWEDIIADDGKNYVNISGDITYLDKPVRATVQFLIKDETFEFNAIEFNGVPQNQLMAMGLLTKMCESADKSIVSSDKRITHKLSECIAVLKELYTLQLAYKIERDALARNNEELGFTQPQSDIFEYFATNNEEKIGVAILKNDVGTARKGSIVCIDNNSEITTGTEELSKYLAVSLKPKCAYGSSENGKAGEGQPKMESSTIVGSWDPDPIPDEPYLLKFAPNGKYELIEDGTMEPVIGVYEISYDKISMRDENRWDFKNADYSLQGNQLVIKNGKGQHTDLKFKKQKSYESSSDENETPEDTDSPMAQIYEVGKKIAEGVSLGIIVGMSSADPDLKHEISTFQDKLTVQGNTWPILDVTIDIKSNLLQIQKITFVLLLEVDKTDGTIVGTAKRFLADGKQDANLDIMNNKMFIESEEGTHQVQVINGVRHIVED